MERYCEFLELAEGKLRETGNGDARQVTWGEVVALYLARRETKRREDHGLVLSKSFEVGAAPTEPLTKGGAVLRDSSA